MAAPTQAIMAAQSPRAVKAQAAMVPAKAPEQLMQSPFTIN